MDRDIVLRHPLNSYRPRAWLTLVGASALILSAAGIAQAQKLTNSGTAILDAGNGSVVVSGNGSTTGCIDWFNGGSPPACTPGTPGSGMLTVDAGSTSPFVVGQTGTIEDLSFETMYPVVDFMSIGGANFDLIDIRTNGGTSIGDCTSADDTDPGVSCTPANSPFTLTNGLGDPLNGNMVDTVSIDFTVDAEGYMGSSGMNYSTANPYVGIFTTQQAISGETIQSILQMIGSGGAIDASWSATFTPASATPEPASFLLLGAGLTAIGLLKRNVRKS